MPLSYKLDVKRTNSGELHHYSLSEAESTKNQLL